MLLKIKTMQREVCLIAILLSADLVLDMFLLIMCLKDYLLPARMSLSYSLQSPHGFLCVDIPLLI